MNTVSYGLTPSGSAPESTPIVLGDANEQRLHRISEVRQQQGVSLRSAARRMGKEVSRLKVQEQETTDLRLSDLYQWQQVLDVPVADLLVEQEASLSHPIMQRAQLVRLMKTATSLLESAEVPATRRMAQMLVDQLVEMMPELAEVSPWHSVGQRRSLDEFGRAFERRISDDMFQGAID